MPAADGVNLSGLKTHQMDLQVGNNQEIEVLIKSPLVVESSPTENFVLPRVKFEDSSIGYVKFPKTPKREKQRIADKEGNKLVDTEKVAYILHLKNIKHQSLRDD